MGYSNWSDDFYKDREAERARTGTDAFVHDRDIRTGRAASGVHALMNPKGVTRESRDSDEHPDSLAIGVMLDVTGSMASLPKQIQQKLPDLMGLVKTYVPHPHILFGAVGDAVSDHAPLQVGQFEAGIEMDDDLGRMYLEGNGGGTFQESYQNAAFFFARHTSCDCWEKRQRKGYLFLIGDEMNYPQITKEEAERLLGDPLEAAISTEDIYREVKERFHVFFIIPKGAYHSNDPSLFNHWAALLGEQHIIQLDNVEAISEVIATTIGLTEQAVDLGQARTNILEAGSAVNADAVATALSTYASSVGAGAAETPKNVRL